MEFFHIYMRDGKFYIPVTAITDAEFYIEMDPVKVVDVGDWHSLETALEEVVRLGNPKIGTPDSSLKPVVLSHTKYKTWKIFQAGASEWGIERRGSVWKLILYRPRRDGRGTEEDLESSVVLEGGGVEVVCKHIAMVVGEG